MDRAPHPRGRRGARRRLDGAGVDRHAGGARRERGDPRAGAGHRGRAGLPPRHPRPAAAPQPQPAARRGVRRAARLPRRPGGRAVHGGGRVGYELALSAVTPGRDEERAVGSLLQDRCEALVLLGPQAPTAYLAEARGPAPGGGRRPRGAQPGGGRRAHRRRGRARTGRRPPRRARAPAHRAHRRRPGPGGGRAPPRLHATRCTGTAWAEQRADGARRADRGRRRRGGPRPARADRSPQPTARHRVQRPLRDGRPGRRSRGAGVAVPGDMSAWWGSTTAAWRACRTSTSPRSPRTPRR